MAFIFFVLFAFAVPWSSAIIVHEAFLYGSKWDYGTLKFFVSEFFLYLSFLCIIFDAICTDYKKVITRPFLLYTGFILSFILLHGFLKGDIFIALQQLRFICAGFLVFVISKALGLSQKYIATLLVSALILPAIYGILQFFTQESLSLAVVGIAVHESITPGTSVVVHPAFGRWVRSYSGFVHPNIFGAYMASALVLLYMQIKHFSANGIKKIYPVLVSLFAIGLFVSFSRSAWIGVLFFMVGFLLMYREKGIQKFHKFFVAAGIVTCILTYVFLPLVQIRLFGGEIHETVSVHERIDMMDDAVILFYNDIVWGTGIGQYTKVLADTFPDRAGWTYQPVHNSFMLLLTEWGMVGGVLLIGGMVFFVKKIYQKNKTELLLVILFLLPAFLVDHFYISMYSGLILIGWYAAYLDAQKKYLTFS